MISQVGVNMVLANKIVFLTLL